MTSWLVADTTGVKGGKIEHTIPERPLLHACCNRDHFGDVNVDTDPNVNPDLIADITERLPFDDDYFAGSFADFPWVKNWMQNTSKALKEMLRVAPIAYTISPWLYGASWCYPEAVHVSWRPGVNHPILFVKYVRTEVE